MAIGLRWQLRRGRGCRDGEPGLWLGTTLSWVGGVCAQETLGPLSGRDLGGAGTRGACVTDPSRAPVSFQVAAE